MRSLPGRRHHDHRNVASSASLHLLAAELPAVHHRHHQVEQDDAGLTPAFEALERLLAVGGALDLEAFQLEEPAQHVAGIDVVFDDENCARATQHHQLPERSLAAADLSTQFGQRWSRPRCASMVDARLLAGAVAEHAWGARCAIASESTSRGRAPEAPDPGTGVAARPESSAPVPA